MSRTAKYKTLSSLPGGNDRYLHTLIAVLMWLADQRAVRHDHLLKHFTDAYNANSSSAGNYVRLLRYLGVIQSDSYITLTPAGKRLLEADDDARVPLVLGLLAERFTAVTAILWLYARTNEPLHLSEVRLRLGEVYRSWRSDSPVSHRLLWLYSLGCLAQVEGQSYRITALGQRMAYRFPPTELQQDALVSYSQLSPIEHIASELRTAAQDSHHPYRLQWAVASAFETLGYVVEQVGEPGSTDVIATAHIGSNRYQVIIDAKSRGDGRLRELSAYTLLDHKLKHEADHVVVVAGSFADGKVVRHAETHNILLMPVDVIVSWLNLHDRTPLNLLLYQALFAEAGLVSSLPPSIIHAAEQRTHLVRLMDEVITLLEETYQHGLVAPFTAEQLFGMLVTRMRGVYYTLEQVQLVVGLLQHPLVHILIEDERGIRLCGSKTLVISALETVLMQLKDA